MSNIRFRMQLVAESMDDRGDLLDEGLKAFLSKLLPSRKKEARGRTGTKIIQPTPVKRGDTKIEKSTPRRGDTRKETFRDPIGAAKPRTGGVPQVAPTKEHPLGGIMMGDTFVPHRPHLDPGKYWAKQGGTGEGVPGEIKGWPPGASSWGELPKKKK